MGKPTPRQQQVADLFEQLGTREAVAQALGLHPVTVSRLLRRWREAMGLQGPPGTRQHAAISLLRLRQWETEQRIAKLEHRVTALEHRPATRVEWHPNHRRVVDGGQPVRDQRRRARVRRRPCGQAEVDRR